MFQSWGEMSLFSKDLKFNLLVIGSMLCLFLIVFTASTITQGPRDAMYCPLWEKISPCTCNWGAIRCVGPTVTQEDVNRMMIELRNVNWVANDQLISTDRTFAMIGTSMMTFDLSPLLNSKFKNVGIYNNPNLSRIHGPIFGSGSEFGTDASIKNYFLGSYLPTIHTPSLDLHGNNLTDEGLADFFHWFSPSLQTLYLHGNPMIQGPATSGSSKNFGRNQTREFLPGLWTFFKLQKLNLYGNRTIVLKDAPFKALGSIQDLALGCVGGVGENAFLMDNTNSVTFKRTIWLNSFFSAKCPLNDVKFHKNHGLQLFKGQTELILSNNAFEVLSREKFEPFLQINVKNTIKCEGNRFVCDRRMKWLKNGRKIYKNQVFGIDCTNDPGQSIFTTKFV